jgi:hypothetical protein
MELIAKKDNFK